MSDMYKTQTWRTSQSNNRSMCQTVQTRVGSGQCFVNLGTSIEIIMVICPLIPFHTGPFGTFTIIYSNV